MTPVPGKPKSPNSATTPMISLENICSSSSKQIDPTVSIQAFEDSKSRLNQLGSLSITRLMSGSSHILCVLIGFTPLRTPRISGLKSQILKPPFLS